MPFHWVSHQYQFGRNVLLIIFMDGDADGLKQVATHKGHVLLEALANF